MKIAFLTCHDLLPGAPGRRADAFEHDFQVAALRAGMTGTGAVVTEIDWRAPIEAFGGYDLALLGTAWDYQDHPLAFLDRLDELAARGVRVCNPPEIVRWNIDKAYLNDLSARGAALVPTLWRDDPGADDICRAFDVFGCDRVVAKRRVGAGAVGQFDFSRSAPPPSEWRLGRAGLIQPFLPSIETEGEYSFIFIGGAFCHAVLKRPAPGDYRIQSSYGGMETPVNPATSDMRAALRVLDALPFETPLYARIDMVRERNGGLCVMEVELIEPYLYPVQGPALGDRLREAILGLAR
jgi:glutathione synthase/RimK-type ligase-like ATP-grasp enzyme